jgi:hypothetical protein
LGKEEQMKFDARVEYSPEKKKAFIAWATEETASMFKRAKGDREGLKSAVFLFSNRVREAGITESEVAEVLGVSVARAALSEEEEADVVLTCAERFDPLAAAVHSGQLERKSWWRFWS